jgi:hypothetical protein
VLNPIHTRDTQLAEWPFESMDDVDEFVVRVTEIVKDAIDAEPEVTVSVTYPDRAFSAMTYDDFRNACTDLPFEGLSSLVIRAYDRKDLDFAVDLILADDKRTAQLAIRGRSVTRVDGVDLQVGGMLDKAIEKIETSRQADARRRRKERADYVERIMPPAPFGVPIGAAVGTLLRSAPRRHQAQGSSAAAKPGRWHRVLNHPWTVTVVGGIVAAVCAGVALTLILR